MVRREDRRAALVALPDDLVQIDRLVADQRAQTEIVDDEHVRRREAQHLAVMRCIGARGAQLGEQVVRARVDHVVAEATRTLPECLRDVRLADAGASDEQHVLLAIDEAASREVDDLRLGDLRVEVKIEVLDRARAFEARTAKADVELLAVATFGFVGKQPK